jgi:hypothetical protein
MRLISILFIVFLSLALFSCERKTNLEFIDQPVALNQIVAYVPIYPFFEGVNQPGDLLAGYDELLYVVEKGTEQLLAYDEAGNKLGEFAIKGINQIAQDRSLECLWAF